MIAIRWLSLLFLVAMQQPAPVAGPALHEAGAVAFDFDWPQAPVPHWSVQVGEDGKGQYDQLGESMSAADRVKRPISVAPETQVRLQSGYHAVIEGNCQTKTKNLAKTGAKHLAYTTSGSDAWSSCTFNYSDDKGLMDAVAAFQAIAETMQAGDKLQRSHRFDRLSLDAQIDQLDSEAKDGRAIEFQNIAAVLQSIIDDERVIERARRKAARLLQTSLPSAASAR